ncbi:MAG TPA: NAD-dependent epimerase/dehydratase family protein [Gemmatimonadales bacterium]|nr:NAD-dependent epimerase/dehydratase family protein [Gemmatimonadales bacterium]
MTARVLVTGAAGFIGSHLIAALATRGDEVVGIDNFDPFYPRAMKERNLREVGHRPGLCLHEIDMLDVDAVAAHLTPDTVLVHLAAKAGVRPSLADPVGYARTNVAGTAAVLEAARRAGTERIVFGSSSSVYGDSTPVPFREDATAIDPVSPYAATKRAGELLVSALAPIHGFRVAALRFFTVYGPRQRPDLAIHAFARRMAAGQPLTLFGDGTQARDYTYCDDIVDGVVAAVDWTATARVGMDVFNLGGSRPMPLGTLVAELSEALGMRPEVGWAPMQPGDVQRTCADPSKARAALGFEARTEFGDGIRRFAAWFRMVDAEERRGVPDGGRKR